MIDFQYVDTNFVYIERNTKWLEKVIDRENKKLGQIVYIFSNDNYLLKNNIKFLKHDSLTDIITFDYCNNDIISGDILISIDRVIENAKIYKVTFLNELDRVMVHGLLHLLGYNDKTKKERKIMTSKEDFYLQIK